MAFSIKAFLSLDGSGFEKGLKTAQTQTGKFAGGLKGQIAGAFSGAALVGGIMKLDDMMERLADKAKEIKLGVAQSGLDPETFQRFNNTLNATGVSADKAFNSLEKLAEATEKIKNGEDSGGKLAESMAAFGVTMDDVKKKDYRQIFFQISEAMRTMAVDAKSLGALSDLLGGKAGDLVPAMKLGFNSRVSTAGNLDDSDLKSLDRMNKMAAEAAGPWKEFGNEVALTLTKVKIGLMSLIDMRGKLTASGSVNAAQEERLLAIQKESAARQLEVNKQKQRAIELEAIRKQFEQKREKLEESLGSARLDALSNDQKLFVLKSQEQVLKVRKGSLGAAIRAGDPTGQFEYESAQNDLMMLQNRQQQQGLVGGGARLDVNAQRALIRNGAEMGLQSDPRAIAELVNSIKELTTTIRTENRTPPRPQNPFGGVEF